MLRAKSKWKISGVSISKLALAATTGAVLLVTSLVPAQSRSAGPYVPLPDPGYSLYFHDTPSSPNIPARWGYHEGWMDGRRDRNKGEIDDSKTKEHYLSPPPHDLETGLTHDSYVKGYRTAYQKGYEHGSRL